MKPYLLIILILAFCAITFGQEKPPFDKDWRYIAHTDTDDGKAASILAYKIPSVVEISPQIYKFWAKEFNSATKEYIQRSTAVDCRMKQFRLYKVFYFDANDKVTKTLDYSNDKFEDAPPDSLADMIINTVCKYKDQPNDPK
jgi:hypothetical protein